MSDLLEEIEVVFPKTVTHCHAEIRRLEGLIAAADKEIDAKESEIDNLESELEDAKDEVVDDSENVGAVINAFLDLRGDKVKIFVNGESKPIRLFDPSEPDAISFEMLCKSKNRKASDVAA